MRWQRSAVQILCLGSGLALGGLGHAARATGPGAAAQPETTLAGRLQSLANRAALVFSGQVVSIKRRGGVVDIEFRVEQPVVGAPGASYTLHEWAGLWPPGQFRYWVGERALLFLHAASAAGVASPVDGAEGVVPVVTQGADQPELADVRRLSASLLRQPGTSLATEAQGAIELTSAVGIVTATRAPQTPLPVLFPEPIRLPMPVRLPAESEPQPIEAGGPERIRRFPARPLRLRLPGQFDGR